MLFRSTQGNERTLPKTNTESHRNETTTVYKRWLLLCLMYSTLVFVNFHFVRICSISRFVLATLICYAVLSFSLYCFVYLRNSVEKEWPFLQAIQ